LFTCLDSITLFEGQLLGGIVLSWYEHVVESRLAFCMHPFSL
jgi:hypothetical protein